MFVSGKKCCNIFYIFFAIIILLSIIQIILISTFKKKLNSIKFSKKEVDIPISALKSIKFVEDKSKPEYNPNTPNLGFTGEIILDCYSGYCTEKETTRHERVCPDDDCEDEYYETTDNIDRINYSCSLECFKLKGQTCDKCYSSKSISSKGKCSRKTNDNYSNEKYCLSDNIIYFWKGEKYVANLIDYRYSYINNAITKNEECPNKMKNCGILDNNENKLCIQDYLNCPINIISEEKLNDTNSSFKAGNKTFYYGYDKYAKNKKIIAGLYVDTDLYLNKKENYVILDTYTISGVLEENAILYKGVDLGFDPYKEKDIDKKGKSYLKLIYNENVDLISMRENHKIYLKKEVYLKSLIDKVKNNFEIPILFGIIGYSLLIFYIFVIVVFILPNKSNKNEQNKCVNFVPFIALSIFLLLYAISTIILTMNSCKNASKLNEIDKEIDISNLKIINIISIIFSLLLYGIILALIVIFCIKRKRKDLLDEQKIKSIPDTSEIKNYESKINFKKN